ncbi:MAG: PhoH family protein, partial [Thermogutta sp.]|nr:PhoH family protein [Thermogutta sp.]
MSEKTLSVVNSEMLMAVLGPCDQHLRMIREAFGVRVTGNHNR